MITPAVAGPFDLGTIVVRTAASRRSRPPPRSPPSPTRSPRSSRASRSTCARSTCSSTGPTSPSTGPAATRARSTAQLHLDPGPDRAALGRFQLGECAGLGFKPKLALRLSGGTKRGGHPALRATLTMPAGRRQHRPRLGRPAALGVPRPGPHRHGLHQGAVRRRRLPAGSIYGNATASSPAGRLPPGRHRSTCAAPPTSCPTWWRPCTGLPTSRSRSTRWAASTRSTAASAPPSSFVPDAPFTKLVTKLPGGKKGLLENSRDICAHAYHATVSYTAHNGAAYVDHPKLRVKCKGKQHRSRAVR